MPNNEGVVGAPKVLFTDAAPNGLDVAVFVPKPKLLAVVAVPKVDVVIFPNSPCDGADCVVIPKPVEGVPKPTGCPKAGLFSGWPNIDVWPVL